MFGKILFSIVLSRFSHRLCRSATCSLVFNPKSVKGFIMLDATKAFDLVD
jgi:hypothetical protein